MLKAIPTAVICIGLTTLLTACNDKTGSTNTEENTGGKMNGKGIDQVGQELYEMVNYMHTNSHFKRLHLCV